MSEHFDTMHVSYNANGATGYVTRQSTGKCYRFTYSRHTGRSSLTAVSPQRRVPDTHLADVRAFLAARFYAPASETRAQACAAPRDATVSEPAQPFPVGSFVVVPYGVNTQVAHVVGYTRTGRIKVRGFNGFRRRWYDGVRTIDLTGVNLAGTRAAFLPEPPALPKPRAQASAAPRDATVSEPAPYDPPHTAGNVGTLDGAALRDFARQWPGSPLRDLSQLAFEFDHAGDLVDITARDDEGRNVDVHLIDGQDMQAASDYAWRRHTPVRSRDAIRAHLRLSEDAAKAERLRLTETREPVRHTWQREPGLCYVERPEAYGLRHVGDVTPERATMQSGYRTGWYSDPDGFTSRDGTGLMWGVVYRLAGRNGQTRLVAGYQDGNTDGGPVLDLSQVYLAPNDYQPETNDVRDVARVADGMAQRAAEMEKDWQSAWRDGTAYAEARAEANDARTRARALIREFRALRREPTATGFPAACEAVRKMILAYLETRATARAKAAKLRAEYQGSSWETWPATSHRARMLEAFCDGADIRLTPA